METKTRKQGNSLTLTVPKEYHISVGRKVIPELRPNGIFYRFVDDSDDFLDFSTDILKRLVAQGISGDELIHEFNQQKHDIASQLDSLATTKDASLLSRKELEAKIGL